MTTRGGSIAVAIPCFNAGAGLAETVRSVLAQRRPAQEIVVVDDGSDDPQTLRALTELPSPVRVLWQPHGGVAMARDAGVRETRSDYLLWLDADDLLSPDYLEVTAQELDRRPELDIVATGFEAFGAEQFVWTPPDPARLELHFADGTFLITALFRRSLWAARGGADPALAALEDWDYWLGALAAGHRALVIDRPLVRIRVTPGSRRLRGLEVDRMAPSLQRVIERQRQSIVGLGPRLIEAKAWTLLDLSRRHALMLGRLSQREATFGVGPRAVVLMYHRAAELTPDPFGLCVPPDLLARQLDAVRQAFSVIGVTALLDAIVQGSAPARAVAVTFDDGYRDALVAADLLEARELPATFFVNTEDLDARHESWEGVLEQLFLGDQPLPSMLSLGLGSAHLEFGCQSSSARRAVFDALHAVGYPLDAENRSSLVAALRQWSGLALPVRDSHRVLTRDELQVLAARRGVEIGVHGAAHLALPLHPAAVQEHELASARSILETLLQRPVCNLAYAYGAHDESTVALAARLGFRSAFSVCEAAFAPWDDPLTLPRIDVGRCDPAALVARIEHLFAAGSVQPAPPAPTPAPDGCILLGLDEHGPAAAHAPLLRCLRGEISPPIALLHLAPLFADSAALLAFLADSAARMRSGEAQAVRHLQALHEFAHGHRLGLALVQRMGVDNHQCLSELPSRGIQAIGDLFDRLAEIDPNTAVALYAFGDTAVLDAASAELVAYLDHSGVLSPTTRMLDLGCGNGRLMLACASRCGSVTGVDVSPRMVAQASARVAHLPNMRVLLGAGLDLEAFAARSLDVVVAADTWPYVVPLGPAAVRALAHEVARVLAPGGEFVVLNFSYREDPALDLADVRLLAAELGFTIVEEAHRPFVLWDGVSWRLRRAPAGIGLALP